MIIFVGGAIRGGKTTFSKKLKVLLNASIYQTDVIMNLFEKTVPQYGLKPGISYLTRIEKFKPIIEEFVVNPVLQSENIIIEGDVLDPKLIHTLSNKDSNIKAIFFGYPDISVEKKLNFCRLNPNKSDWLISKSEAEQKRLILEGIDRSFRLQNLCKDFGITFVDTGTDYINSIELALKDFS